MKTNALTSLLAAAMALPALAQETPITLQVEQIATGLTRICDISHCGDDRLFLTLQAGNIRIMQADNTLLATPFLNITDRVNDTGNEQGLLGLAFPPDYATSGKFYVYYTAGTGAGTSRVSRFSVTSDPNVADAASEEILYTVTQPYTNHNGGDLNFGPDGMLYVGFGDGGSGGDPQDNAQNMSTPLGKIIRLDVSGATGWAVPADNPFANANPADTLPEIFASGLRNPWRWGFDAQTGDVWIGDVGQNAVEELDYWPAGDLSGPNFGWRCYEATSVYNTAGCQPASFYVPPVAFHPQGNQGWCSIIGGRVYRGPTYWRIAGHHIYTDYCGGQFYSLRPDEFGGWTRTQVLASGVTGWSVIGENSSNEIFGGNNSNGRLYRIKELCTELAPVIAQNGTELSSTSALGYQWYLGNTPVANATSQTFTPTANGSYRVLANTQAGCQLFSNAIEVFNTGVDAMQSAGVSVRPVPADAAIFIDGAAQGTAIDLLDAQGRLVRSAAQEAAGQVTLNTVKLPSGLYTVRLTARDGRVILRQQVTVAH